MLINTCLPGTSPFGSYDHESMVYALKDCNYRHIDTAEMYGSEPMVGKDIKVCDPV